MDEPECFHRPSVSNRASPSLRPQGAMTRPMARKSPRSACSWSRRRTTSGATRMNARSAGGRLDAVLPPVPRGVEQVGDLLEVVHEEPPRVLAELLRLPASAQRVGGQHPLQLLGEGRLRDLAGSDPEQLDLPLQRRVLALVQRADDVVRRRKIGIRVELPAREGHEVRRVEPRVLGVDRHKHLDDVILGQAIEDHGGHAELLRPEALDIAVQREQAVLAVDGAEDALALGHLQGAQGAALLHRLEPQRFVAGDDHRAGNRGQVAGLPTLLVVVHELFDLLADDLPLVRALVRRDPALEQVPVDLRLQRLTAASHRRMPLFGVAQDLETDELVDVAGRQRRLVERHAKLVHPDGSNVDHGQPSR